MKPRRRVELVEGLDRRLDDVRAALASHLLSTVPGLEEEVVTVVDYVGLSPDERAALAHRPAEKPLVLVGGATQAHELVELFGRPVSNHLIARDDRVDAGDLAVTVSKLLGAPLFGIDPYFPTPCHRWSGVLRQASHRFSKLTEIEAFAQHHAASARRAGLFRMVAEELVTNALYDAPADGQGRPRYRHFAREIDVVLEPREQVHIELRCDERRLGISVLDPFGSLVPGQVFEYLAKGLRKSADQIDQKPGGAGLGLYAVFSAVNHLVVNIDPGKRTEMIGLLEHQGRHRAFLAKSKSFNLFVSES